MPDRLSPQAERLLRKLVALPAGVSLVLDRGNLAAVRSLDARDFVQFSEAHAALAIHRYFATQAGRDYIDALDQERQAAAEEGLHV